MRTKILFLAFLLFGSAAHAANVLREDTATQIALGPFIDGTDGITPETALTVTEWDCDIIKHADSGMATTSLTITASGGSNDAAHLASGLYSLELTATDTSTAGRLVITCDHATPATFLQVTQDYMVMPTQEFDSLYGTDVLQVHAVEIANDLITAAAIATDAIGAAEIAADAIGASEIAANAIAASEIATGAITSAKFAASAINAAAIATDAITAAKIAADAIGASEIAADAGTEIGTATWATTTRVVTAATNITSTGGTTVPQTGDSYARLGAPTDFGSGTSTIAANLQDLADNGTATFDRSTDSLQAIRDQGDSAWVTGGGGACTADVGCIADGTAQAATSTSIQLASAETFADDELIGATVLINSATAGTGQARLITDYVSSTDTATVDTWTTTPTGTITYRVFGTPPGSSTSPAPANVTQWLGTAAATPTTAGVPEVDVTFVSGTAQTANDNGADINAILVDTAEIGSAGAGLTALATQTSVNTIDGIVDSILVDTAEIGAAGAGLTEAGGTGDHLTAVPWNAAWDAEVQSEANDALVAIHLDHLLAVDYDPASQPGTATALLNELIESDAGVSRFTVNALENGPSGSGASAESIADAVWEELQADHTTVATFGVLASEIASILVDTAEIGSAGAGLTALATQSSVNTVDGIVDSILVDTAEIGAAGAGLTAVPWNAAWDAEVESEVDDALGSGTGTALTAIPWNASWDAEVQSEATDAINATLEQHVALDPMWLNCEVNTANFAGSTTTLACILTDRDGGAVTRASGDLTGLGIVVLSGAEQREQRFINSTTWDAGNSELQLTLSRALPGVLADAVSVLIR